MSEVKVHAVLTCCNVESFATRVRDGLTEAYPNNVFEVRPARAMAEGWLVRVVTSAAGLRLVTDHQLYGMTQFALGFHACLRAHCSF